MTTADKLRGLMQGATKYLVDHGPDHDDGCPEDDTCNCETGRNQRDLDRIVRIHPALAAVVEAARRVHESRDDNEPVDRPSMTVVDVNMAIHLDAALSALDAAVAREVG